MTKICLLCGKEFECHSKTKYCCLEHRVKHQNLLVFPDGSDYVECKICGHRGADLYWHIRKFHNMTIEEYCSKYNLQSVDLKSMTHRKNNSERQKQAYREGRTKGWGKGDANPSRRKEVREGRRSIFSENYVGYDGLTHEEKRQKIDALLKTLAENKKKNKTNPLTLDYYLAKGYSEDEAKAALKERQATFTLEKCIAKYGEEKGTELFNERQKKWQNTLSSKPIEELERISKAKMLNGKGWSKISQKLFDAIAEAIRGEFNCIFYATNSNVKENNEYMVFDNDTHDKFFLDFYVQDNNKVIEFDGDYWHGEKRGNQKREKEREDKLRQLGFVNIFHVKECDYNADPEKVLQECLQFIRK